MPKHAGGKSLKIAGGNPRRTDSAQNVWGAAESLKTGRFEPLARRNLHIPLRGRNCRIPRYTAAFCTGTLLLRKEFHCLTSPERTCERPPLRDLWIPVFSSCAVITRTAYGWKAALTSSYNQAPPLSASKGRAALLIYPNKKRLLLRPANDCFHRACNALAGIF